MKINGFGPKENDVGSSLGRANKRAKVGTSTPTGTLFMRQVFSVFSVAARRIQGVLRETCGV